jgi:hypothetical protein
VTVAELLDLGQQLAGVALGALLVLVVAVGIVGEDGERSEPPAAGAAEGRALDCVKKALTRLRLDMDSTWT